MSKSKYAEVIAPTLENTVFVIQSGPIRFEMSVHLHAVDGDPYWSFSRDGNDKIEECENIVRLSDGTIIRQFRTYSLIQKDSLSAIISADDGNCLIRTFGS